MSKFLDKKQTVFEIKLTNHGKYLLANGRFKPIYYTFLDDNIIYDSNYSGYSETQNSTHQRIKKETQYLEALVDFESVEKRSGRVRYSKFDSDMYKFESGELSPQKSNFYYENHIGDARNTSDVQSAPSMKIIALKGQITGSSNKDIKNNFNIPQINIEANYTLKAEPPAVYTNNINSYSTLINKTLRFADDNVISLHSEDVMVYAEELNTEILNENFEIEIFEVEVNNKPPEKKDGPRLDNFKRKLFKKEFGKINGGYMSDYNSNVTNKLKADNLADNQITNQAVAQYFNILTDYEINRIDACKSAAIFNKESYYVDIDFDCDDIIDTDRSLNIDIYGVVTEPEIC